jgi:nucleoid DNA-binding protein
MLKINRAELARRISDHTTLSGSECDMVLGEMLRQIRFATGNGVKVQFTGFGSFSLRTTAEHPGKNPRTGETITIKAQQKLRFKASKTTY